MGLITEASLRALIKKENIQTFIKGEKDIITPSARQFLKERRIVLIEDNGQAKKQAVLPSQGEVTENHYKGFKPSEEAIHPKFISYYDGGFYEEKPEHMTHIKGNQLVFKDDKRIRFRGRLDSLQSTLMEMMLQLKSANNAELVSHLEEILGLVRRVLRAEVLEEPLTLDQIIGLSPIEIREHSHNPQKHYGISHFLPDVSMGIEMVLLNKLRTEIREVELVAMETFRQGSNVTRTDLILIFNRLSSVAYILMCRIRSQSINKVR